MELELQEATGYRNRGQVPVLPPVAPASRPAATSDDRTVIQNYLAELDVYYAAIKGFSEQEPDLVMQQVSAYSARLLEIRGMLQRMGSTRASQLRTREVEPMMEQLEFQFKIASRRISDREFDFRLSGGQT